MEPQRTTPETESPNDSSQTQPETTESFTSQPTTPDSVPAKKSSALNPALFFSGVAVLVIIVGAVLYFQSGLGQTASVSTGNGTLSPAEAAEPVALVNGVEITRGELADNVAQLTQNAQQSGMDVSDLVVQTQIETQAYDILVNNELLRQATVAAGIPEPTDEEVETQINTIIEENGGAEVFAGLLEQFGLTEEKLREDIKDNLHIQAYFNSQTETTEVTDTEVQDYYDNLGGEEAGLPPLAEISEQVKQQISLEREQEQISAVIEELRENGEIERLQV